MNNRDQSLKTDAGKPRISLVPLKAFAEDVAEVREFGVQKYKDVESWKKVSVDRYVDAMLRHLLAWLEDPNGVAEDSGINHFKHFECNVAFIAYLLREKEKPSKETDRNFMMEFFEKENTNENI